MPDQNDHERQVPAKGDAEQGDRPEHGKDLPGRGESQPATGGEGSAGAGGPEGFGT